MKYIYELYSTHIKYCLAFNCFTIFLRYKLSNYTFKYHSCNKNKTPELKCSYYHGEHVVGPPIDVNDELNPVFNYGPAIDAEYSGVLNITDYATDITRIGSFCFWNCKIKEVIIPNTVYSIGCCAFWDCGIEKIELGPNITEIGFTAFSGTYKLKHLDLTKTKIKEFIGHNYPFYWAQLNGTVPSAVEQVLFPDGFKYENLDSYSFYKVKNWTYQKNVKYIDYEFMSSSSLESIYSENENVKIINGAAFLYDEYRKPSILIKQIPISIITFSHKITKILSSSFQGFNISKLSFQYDVDEIESSSFSDCNIDTFVISHLPRNGFNLECKNLIITSNAKSNDEAKSIEKVNNIYYCGARLFNATAESNQNKYITYRYKYEYFLKSKNFSLLSNTSICGLQSDATLSSDYYFFDILLAFYQVIINLI